MLIIYLLFEFYFNTFTLDFDAYTSNSVAWNNLCEDNKDEGIFVEETAHNNIIVGNTCRRNGNGIGVYSNGIKLYSILF